MGLVFLLGVGALVAVINYALMAADASLTASTVLSHSNGSSPIPGDAYGPNSGVLTTLMREGQKWVRHARTDGYIWAAVLLFVAFMFVVLHAYHMVKYGAWMNNFYAVGLVLIAAAVIVGVGAYARCASTSATYAAVQRSLSDGSDPTVVSGAGGDTWVVAGTEKDNADFLIALGRRGVTDARDHYRDGQIWAAVLTVLAVLMFFAAFYMPHSNKH